MITLRIGNYVTVILRQLTGLELVGLIVTLAALIIVLIGVGISV